MFDLAFRDLRFPRLGAMRSGTAFSPVSLFANDEAGVWFDPSDMTTLSQDSAGTTPVTAVGQPVGLMLDKSGNGHHATQATASKRPTYQSDGTLHWLAFDGVDDGLTTGAINLSGTAKVTFHSAQTFLPGSLARGLHFGAFLTGHFWFNTPTSSSAVELSANGGAIQSTPTTVVGTGAHVYTGKIDFTAPLVSLAVDQNTPVTNVASLGAATGFATDVLSIGSQVGGSRHLAGNIYSVILRGALSSNAEVSSTEKSLAKKSGVALP